MPRVVEVRRGKGAAVRVRWQDGRTLRIPYETWQRLGVPPGASVDSEVFSYLERESTLTRLRQQALRLLAERPRSAHELRARLSKSWSGQMASLLVAELEKQGLVDDERFAAEWVQVRRAVRGLGSVRLRYELARKGIAADVVDRVVQEASADDPSLAASVTRRLLARYAHVPTEVAARRLAALLARRGFTSEAVAHALKAVGLWPGRGRPDTEGSW